MTIRASRGDTVMGNEIQYSAKPLVTVIAKRKNLTGVATAANGEQGLYITGDVRGTRVQGNAISDNTGDGVMLVNARKLTIGGNSAVNGNGIVSNLGYGLYAFGVCTGSVVQSNVIVANAQGNVNLTKLRGIKYVP